MKITGIETFSVAVPPPHKGGREWYFVRVDTDQGVHGWGEMALLHANVGKSRSLEHETREIARDWVVGEDPRRREWIWKRMYQNLMCHHADLTRMVVLSGIDMALWDIVGKIHDTPVYQLLGGAYRERVRSYSYIYDAPESARPGTSHLWMDSEAVAARAAIMAKEGFTGLKLDPIPQRSLAGEPATPWHLTLEELDTAERTVRLIREAVGSTCDILIGTHGQITASAAIRLAKRLEPYDPLWLEEPVPPENAREMAKVARGTSIPIATGERLSTVWDFLRIFEEGAVAIAQPDLCCCGGITEFRKIAGMAEAYYIQMAPHVWGGPILSAASIQMDMCTPNFLIQESIEKSGGFFDELLVEPLIWDTGYLLPPPGPGLGVELDEQALRRHAVVPTR